MLSIQSSFVLTCTNNSIKVYFSQQQSDQDWLNVRETRTLTPSTLSCEATVFSNLHHRQTAYTTCSKHKLTLVIWRASIYCSLKMLLHRYSTQNRKLSALLTNSSLTYDPWHADEEHHTPDVQHAADLHREGLLVWVGAGSDQPEKYLVGMDAAELTFQCTSHVYGKLDKKSVVKQDSCVWLIYESWKATLAAHNLFSIC